MVIRFDTHRVKKVVDRAAEPLGVDGDPSMAAKNGVSEADKIVEGARKSMANAGLADNPEKSEKVLDEVLEGMSKEDYDPESAIEEAAEENKSKIKASSKSEVE